MGALIKAYFSYRKDPEQVVRELVSQRRFAAAMWGYAVAALCWVCFFWLGDGLSAWGFVWRFVFFFLLEISLCYLWAALSGLFLSFFSHEDGSAALFIAFGLSGFVQGLLLCYALISAAMPELTSLAALVFFIVMMVRFTFVVMTTARGVQVGMSKALGALCFVLVPAVAAVFLSVGAIILLANLFA